MFDKSRIFRNPVSGLLPNSSVADIDQLHLFGDAYLLGTFKNNNYFIILDLKTEKLIQKDPFFGNNRSKIAASTYGDSTMVVCITQGDDKGEQEDSLKNTKGDSVSRDDLCSTSETSFSSSVIIINNICASLKIRRKLWPNTLTPSEVVGLWCGDTYIVFATQDALFKCSYFDPMVQEIKPQNSKKILTGLKSPRSSLKKNLLLLISKNNKNFQVWNIETGECILEYSSNDAFALITIDNYQRGRRNSKKKYPKKYISPSRIKSNNNSTNLQSNNSNSSSPLFAIVGSTKSKLMMWTSDQLEPIVYEQKFISAIHLYDKKVIVGDILNGIYLYHLGRRAVFPLNVVKTKGNDDELSRMNSGIFSVSMFGDYAITGSNRSIEIWSTNTVNQLKPISKLKVDGVVSQIFHCNEKFYFLIKKDSSFEIIVWDPPQEGNLSKSDKLLVFKKNDKKTNDTSHTSDSNNEVSDYNSLSDSTESTTDNKEGSSSIIGKFNIFKGKQADAIPVKVRRGSQVYVDDNEAEGNTERGTKKTKSKSANSDGSEQSETSTQDGIKRKK